MENNNKQKFLIWAVVVLVVMNISTLATIVYHNKASVKEVVREPAQLEADAEKYSGRYFRDKLNLDQNQMDQFRRFNPVFRRQAMEVTRKLAENRREMLNEMAGSESDTTRLNALSDSIGILHSRLKKLTWNYYTDIKEICSSSQRELLEQLFTEMFINDLPMGYPGQGGMGRQRGRNSNF